MCSIARRCRDKKCDGKCASKKVLWKTVLEICPNLKNSIGEADFIYLKIVSLSKDESRAKKNVPINSYPDTFNECEKLCKMYDREISDALESNKKIDIAMLIEYPFMIGNELFTGKCSCEDSRRLVYVYICSDHTESI